MGFEGGNWQFLTGESRAAATDETERSEHEAHERPSVGSTSGALMNRAAIATTARDNG